MRLAFLASLVAVALGLVSCAHYHLGTGAEPRFQTLHVAVVKSDVLVPQAAALVSTQVREAFIKDGRVRLVDSPAEADATLTLTLEDYHREQTVARADDTGLARRYDLILQARATLTDQRTKKIVFANQPLKVSRGAFTDSGQLQSEYQTLPLLAEQLAERALHAVLDTW
ncbi:LPS assembly lipoprotein LptE [Oleiharenicola sp. Vm1]|uniref:LPS assembly lipoprotein LptE n=1 Tax=Oleiharenicola sp. Vm1 TaxID=3398393 RepID=UPI0039F4ECEC